jgi:secondary thiamine-phosphate synthase enzyme
MTSEIKLWIESQRLLNGLLTLQILHTSASLLINENYDPDVLVDLKSFFDRLVPDGDKLFTHTTEGVDDMPAHIRTALTQTSLSIPVKDKRALLGQWQGIFIYEHRYGEFNRRVNLHLIGE